MIFRKTLILVSYAFYNFVYNKSNVFLITLYWIIFLYMNAHYKFKTECLTPPPLCSGAAVHEVLR